MRIRAAVLRPSLALPVVLLSLGSLTACDLDDFAVDTPLGVVAASRSVTPGSDITGTVVYPDGKITATLAPFASPPSDDVDAHRTEGELPCTTSDDDEKFSCPTDGLPEGLYVVQVTDADQPGEGTATDRVAVTSVAGYDPLIELPDDGYVAAADPVVLRLSGWGADRTVRLTVRDENGMVVHRGPTRVDAAGAAEVDLGRLTVGTYEIAATDGLWVIDRLDGTYESFNVVSASPTPEPGE